MRHTIDGVSVKLTEMTGSATGPLVMLGTEKGDQYGTAVLTCAYKDIGLEDLATLLSVVSESIKHRLENPDD